MFFVKLIQKSTVDQLT